MASGPIVDTTIYNKCLVVLRLNDIRCIEKYAPEWNTNINRTISISFRNDGFKVVPRTTTISFICRWKIEGRTMHPSIVFSSSSSSAKINAIEQFAGIICLWSCLTTILWWLVFDQFQAAVIMVDPLKIFWVLTNSTYLGMSVCLWHYALYLRLSPLFFRFLFHLFIIVRFIVLFLSSPRCPVSTLE